MVSNKVMRWEMKTITRFSTITSPISPRTLQA